jgi:heptaprenyl diphosphate synthase
MKSENIQKLTFTALLAAVTIVLSAAETFLLPPLPAGVRLGLSNVAVMCALILTGVKPAAVCTILKSGFVLITRGVVAGFMSLSGGLLALLALILLLRLKSTITFAAVIAAVCHVVGQLACSAVITESIFVFAYAPLPLLTSIASGILTGIITLSITNKLRKQSENIAHEKLRRDTPLA